MNIFRINNKYVVVAIFLMLAVTLQAQDYGALQYMLQKRPANEKFESNKFNEHLFFSAGIGPYVEYVLPGIRIQCKPLF